MLLALKAKYWIICIVICYAFVTTNGCQDICNKSTIKASLGSNVLLPCSFKNTVLGNSSSQEWVLWEKSPDRRLVNITSKGRINFLDPRQGRVKAFPYQGNLWNYSIRIDTLQDSDLGWYCCAQSDRCHRVEVVFQEGLGAWNRNVMLLFCISGGVVLLILFLSSCCVCYMKFTRHYEGSPPDYENINFKTDTSASAPPPELIACDENARRGEEQERENNEHDTTINQPQDLTRNDSVRNESQRRQLGFHRELISRLRQSSLGRRYYVNQAELSQQGRSPLGNSQREGDYVNPIYSNSTGQLNKL